MAVQKKVVAAAQKREVAAQKREVAAQKKEVAAQKKGEAALRKGERAEAAARVQELKNLHEGKPTAPETAPDGIHKRQKVVDELQSADKNIDRDNPPCE